MKLKNTIVAGSAIAAVVLGGVGASLAWADPTSPAPSATPSASQSAKAGHQAGQGKHRGLFKRALHGEATLGGKKHRVVVFQRGTVTAVDGAKVTVKSTDNFSATYVVNGATKIRRDKKPAATADIKANAKVRVVALKDGSTLTVRRIALG